MVYVDDMRAVFKGMIMCHMVADNIDELHEMAVILGVRDYFQDGRHPHYDISLSKRKLAIKLGATECSRRDSVKISINSRKEWKYRE